MSYEVFRAGLERAGVDDLVADLRRTLVALEVTQAAIADHELVVEATLLYHELLRRPGGRATAAAVADTLPRRTALVFARIKHRDEQLSA